MGGGGGEAVICDQRPLFSWESLLYVLQNLGGS